jgi:hypothetical protein
MSDEERAELCRRIMDLEACLVYVMNFLPDPLKKHCEEVMWTDKKPNPTTS